MKPGQLTPNEFETAILKRIASSTEVLRPLIGHLHVLSRKFTGAGSYTTFKIDPAHREPRLGDQHLGLNGLIVVPHVRNGMGAVLMCRDGCPEILETFTYGDDHWDGTFDGFSIANA
jgi:hypothetical protein